ncbi:hypothetical protein DFH29DRAFT_515291 [Suillus ampliporus]|nr:hypothetical protein DFH29DRAFT_515291 [Suillus ampliporus]
MQHVIPFFGFYLFFLLYVVSHSRDRIPPPKSVVVHVLRFVTLHHSQCYALPRFQLALCRPLLWGVSYSSLHPCRR